MLACSRTLVTHNLLEEGNKPELVSKMLGHASSLTTEKYYLKESAAEVSTRLNIPWLSREKTNATLPSFLKDDRSLSGQKIKIMINIAIKLFTLLYCFWYIISSLDAGESNCLPKSCVSSGCCSGNCAYWCRICEIDHTCVNN